jgi:hypothetical protein
LSFCQYWQSYQIGSQALSHSYSIQMGLRLPISEKWINPRLSLSTFEFLKSLGEVVDVNIESGICLGSLIISNELIASIA